MMIRFFNYFTKITGYPMQWFCFHAHYFYEDKDAQGRYIKGPAILISNHTSVWDYALILFTFFFRTVRYQMAEILFEKKPLGLFLRMMGGIRVDRDTHDFGFIAKSEAILDRGGIVGIFPESRLPREGEERPLPFKPSAAHLALMTGVKVIPIYCVGSYFNGKNSHVVIGKPFYAADYLDDAADEKENLERVSNAMREQVITLRSLIPEKYSRDLPPEGGRSHEQNANRS